MVHEATHAKDVSIANKSIEKSSNASKGEKDVAYRMWAHVSFLRDNKENAQEYHASFPELSANYSARKFSKLLQAKRSKR